MIRNFFGDEEGIYGIKLHELRCLNHISSLILHNLVSKVINFER